ncbi:MAG: ATP-binding protein [Candidatus Woesearchaeota archaeon]
MKTWLLGFLPLWGSKKKQYESLRSFLDEKELRYVKVLLHQQHINVAFSTFGTTIVPDEQFPQIFALSKAKDLQYRLERWNKTIKQQVRKRHIHAFSEHAFERIVGLIAPHIEGFDMIKKAVALQLVSTERFHILLLGDPGTGKTDIVRSALALHEHSAFGLGSGTSGVGLTASVQGKEVTEGLLPKAHLGVCGIDELNLMQAKDMGSLYNAMEKGFVTYTKGRHDIRFEAQVRILATANPKGDKFVGKSIAILKEQIPFDSALLTRFHLVFLLRAPNAQQFASISKKIISHKHVHIQEADIAFIQDYVAYAETIDVSIPKHLEQQMVDFITELKKQEHTYMVEISARTVHGLMRLAQASARMHLRKQISEDDLAQAQQIMRFALQ